jgi:Protein-tyrosine phosphatase
VDGFRRKKQFIVAEVPDANSVALFWCMIKQNQIEQVIVLNEPGPDEALFMPEQCEKMIYNGITVTYLREYYMKNSKIISCGLENVRELFLKIFSLKQLMVLGSRQKNGQRRQADRLAGGAKFGLVRRLAGGTLGGDGEGQGRGFEHGRVPVSLLKVPSHELKKMSRN